MNRLQSLIGKRRVHTKIIQVNNLLPLRAFNILTLTQTTATSGALAYFGYLNNVLDYQLHPYQGLGISMMVVFSALELYFTRWGSHLVTDMKVDSKSVMITNFGILSPTTRTIKFEELVPCKDIRKRVVPLRTTNGLAFHLFLSPNSIQCSEDVLRGVLQENRLLK